jgi:hypothetical protein
VHTMCEHGGVAVGSNESGVVTSSLKNNMGKDRVCEET